MRSVVKMKKLLAVLLALIMTLAVIPAGAVLTAEGETAADKEGAGVLPDENADGRIVLEGKLPEDSEPERQLSSHGSQSFNFSPDSTGAYTGDYIIIYNPDYKDTTGKSTGTLTNLISTAIDEHLDGTTTQINPDELCGDEVCQYCGTPEMMESESQEVPCGEEFKGERISYAVNSTRNFKLSQSPTSSDTIGFTCLAVGEHCYVWTPTNKTTTILHPLDSIDTGYAQTYADEFDAKFDLMRSSFGDHWNGSSGDGKVHLVFYNINNNDWLGFFSVNDFTNNGVPMINIDTYPAILDYSGNVADASEMFNVIVHEYQHLIHYSVCHEKEKATESMLTEMMSAAAEELCYPGSSIVGRIPNWLGIWANNYPYTDPYFEWKNGQYWGSSGALGLYGWSATSGLNSVSQYGKVSLYAQFLYTHLGGNSVFKTILSEYANHSSYTSGDAVDAVIRSKASAYSYSTETFNRAFWIAMTMNPGPGTSIQSNVYERYGFKTQDGYEPADYYGLTNPYDLLCPLIYTGTGRKIMGGAVLVVKPKNGRFIPPSDAASGLKYIGVFTNEKLHHETVNGEFNTYIYNNNGLYPFRPVDGAAKSSHKGVNNSNSLIAYECKGYAGSIRFRCRVSGEGGTSNFYDGLKVYFNNTNEESLQLRLATTEAAWRDYEITFPENSTVHLVWFQYVKDANTSNGDDCAWIDDVEFVAKPDPTLDEALNYDSGAITFSTGSDYPFYVDYVNADDVGVSGNAHANDSVSYVTCRVPMYCGDDLTFEYFYDTETNYDWFDFLVNGEQRMHKSGKGGWTDYTFTAYTTGIYTFEWRYTKDVSGHTGEDCVKLDNVRYISAQEQTYTVDYSLNIGGGKLKFKTNSWPTFSGDFWYDDTIVTAYNFNRPNSTATIETTVSMLIGDELRFEYYVSSEDNYDWFDFTVNGESYMHLSGNLGWHTYRFDAQETGTYTFVWKYTKDGSVSKYMDTVKLDNVEHIKFDPSLDTVLNAKNTDVWLHFESSGEYPFRVNRDNIYALLAESSNDGEDASYSSMTASVYLHKGDVMSFYYTVSSEENYDWFDFKADGTRLIHSSGSPGAQYFTYFVPSTGVHNFEWRYTKDNDRSDGEDKVFVTEVRIWEAEILLGDVNFDGDVTILDAVMTLRNAMGLVDFDNAQKVRGDVNDDGDVTILDAVLILRYAMGIITDF